jgi:phosphoribosylaminoimidazole carboxylase (NCAIR synthetase)
MNRKMGHITIVNTNISKAIEIGKKIKEQIKVRAKNETSWNNNG